MRRFLPVLCLLALVVSCGTKDDGELNNSTNNAPNNSNNTEDVGSDVDEQDAAPDSNNDLDAGSDADSGQSDLTTCVPVTSAPYTLPATLGASITFDFECVTSTSAPDLSNAEIAYEIAFPDGSTSSGTTTFQIGEGTISATISVDPQDFAVGQAIVKFSSTNPALKFDEATTGQFVFHQTVDEVNQTWKGLVSFGLVPPTPTAQLLEQRPGDYNADGVVDVLAVWRYDHAIGVQVLSGPDFNPGAVSEVFVGPNAASTSGQGIRIGYAKGVSDDTSLGLHWYGLNSVDNSLDIASVVLSNGLPGQVTRYTTADFALPGPTAILGVDLVDEGNLQAGDATELMVLYAGLNGPKESFLTVQTSKRDNKLGLVSQQDHLGGVTPTQAASSVHVGLMRGLDASHDPRQAADALKMTAWTLGETTTPGQPEFRRIGLRGAEVGLTQSAWNVSLQTGEAGFQVEVLQGGQEPYVVLTSVQDPSQVPTIRAWKMVGNIAESPKTYQPGVEALAIEWHKQLQTYKNTRVREHRPRLVTSDEYPFYAQLAAAKGLPAGLYFGVGLDLGQAFGPLKKFEPIYSLDTEAAVLKAIATQGGSSSVSVTPDDSIASGSTRTGNALSKRLVDDVVVVASHPNGTVLKVTNHAVVTGAPGNKTTVDALVGKGPILGLFEVQSTGSTYLVQAQGDQTQWLYQVYRVDGADLVGPATVKVSKAHGTFHLMSYSGQELAFLAESGDADVSGSLKAFAVPGAELANAVQTKATFEIADAALKGLGGVSQPRAARLKYGAEAARVHAIRSTHNNERRLKADKQRDLMVGAMIAPGVQETYAVMGNDDADDCRFQTNLFSDDLPNPVVIGEATMDGCWDLHVPVATADFCGVGGSQVMTVAVTDTSSRTVWTWQALLWMRMGDRLMATEFGTFQLAPGVAPQTSATDFNGDGLVDLLISGPVSELSGPLSGASLVLLGDGLGGNLGAASLETFTDVFDVLPNAGDGLGAGQVACGAGLQCNLGTGTRTSSSQASHKAELL